MKKNDILLDEILSWEDWEEEKNKIENNPFIKANYSLKTLKRINLVSNILCFIFMIDFIYQAFPLLKFAFYIGICFFTLNAEGLVSYMLTNITDDKNDINIHFLILGSIYYLFRGVPLKIKQAINYKKKL